MGLSFCRSPLFLPRSGAHALALGLALLWAAPALGCSKPITMATGQWEPYGYYDAQQRFTGIDADMARLIFDEAGCTLVPMASMPAVRNMALFDKGGIDMMTGASLTPARLKRAWFSLPYRDETVGIFSLADNAAQYRHIRSYDAFLALPLTLLAPRVGWYGPDYDRSAAGLIASKRLSLFVDFRQGMRMLAAGRASFIMGDAAAVEHAATRQGIKVQPLPFWLVQAQVHLMFSRATVKEADVRRIDAAIERLRRRGALEQIRHSYGGM
jgi:polar amino acid transport system substrate-binding protein